MPRAYHTLSAADLEAIALDYEQGATASDIEAKHTVTAYVRKKVLAELGFRLGNRGAVPIEQRVRFARDEQQPGADARSDAGSAVSEHTVSCSELDALLEPENLTDGQPQLFRSEAIAPPAQAPRPSDDHDEHSDAGTDLASLAESVSPSEMFELAGSRLEASNPAAADPERDLILLQCRMYTTEFAEVLGPQLTGQTKQARKRFAHSLDRLDKEALREVLRKCEMVVGGSNAHELLKGGLSMGCRAAEFSGAMLGLRLDGYHDSVVASPVVDGLLRELRIRHIGRFQQVLTPEQRLGGVLLMGLIACDSQNRFRAAHAAELAAPVPDTVTASYADL